MNATNLTTSIETLSYRQLQYALKQYDDCGCKRNSKKDVLRVELLRLAVGDATKYEQLIAEMPAVPTSQSRAKFDWKGLATSRKDAIEQLKKARTTVNALQSVKLNGTNASLLAALETLVSDSHEAPVMVTITKTPNTPKARTVAATVAPKASVLVVDVTDITEGPTLQERADTLLKARTKWQTRLALDKNDALAMEYLEEVTEELNALPARAFV